MPKLLVTYGSVYKSNRLQVHILRFSFIKLVYML